MSKAATDTLDKVSAEFETEVLSELQEGKTEALSRIEANRKETEESTSKILETSVKQAESLKRQIVGAAELQARNAQLRSLEKAVNEVFDMAMKEISESEGAAYERAMVDLIKQGLDVIGHKASVSCSTKDKKAVSAAIHKLNSSTVKLTLEDKHIETIGGVILTTSDGSVRFDNTFEARLERDKATLRKEVAGILTGSA